MTFSVIYFYWILFFCIKPVIPARLETLITLPFDFLNRGIESFATLTAPKTLTEKILFNSLISKPHLIGVLTAMPALLTTAHNSRPGPKLFLWLLGYTE